MGGYFGRLLCEATESQATDLGSGGPHSGSPHSGRLLWEATLGGYSEGLQNLGQPIRDLEAHTLGVYTLGGYSGRLLW